MFKPKSTTSRATKPKEKGHVRVDGVYACVVLCDKFSPAALFCGAPRASDLLWLPPIARVCVEG